MPTIQFRTDDRTKDAATALFDKLGITMSNAINMFLRQAVMRQGIPFSLTVSQPAPDAVSGFGIDGAVLDAAPQQAEEGNAGQKMELLVTQSESEVKIRLKNSGMVYCGTYPDGNRMKEKLISYLNEKTSPFKVTVAQEK
jgi:DNA-damage-inducible protein J